MIGQIFTAIEVILKLLKLWDGFMNYMVDKHSADIQARQQARNKAIDDSKGANTDDEIWKSQDDIVSNNPKP